MSIVVFEKHKINKLKLKQKSLRELIKDGITLLFLAVSMFSSPIDFLRREGVHHL